jgi:hypothetical protein
LSNAARDADLVVEMEKRLKEAKQQAEKSNIELAQSKERLVGGRPTLSAHC